MQTQSDTLRSEDQQSGKFAAPCEEIYIDCKHAGTVYRWEDGIKTTVWFEGSRPDGDIVSKGHVDQRTGWRDGFSSKT